MKVLLRIMIVVAAIAVFLVLGALLCTGIDALPKIIQWIVSGLFLIGLGILIYSNVKKFIR